MTSTAAWKPEVLRRFNWWIEHSLFTWETVGKLAVGIVGILALILIVAIGFASGGKDATERNQPDQGNSGITREVL